MNAVGRAAQKMVNEVRRQFREIKGIMDGKAEPDYARCVEISTRGAQREMLFPSLLAIIIPIFTGLLFGVQNIQTRTRSILKRITYRIPDNRCLMAIGTFTA